MVRTIPTEDSLGLGPTADELAENVAVTVEEEPAPEPAPVTEGEHVAEPETGQVAEPAKAEEPQKVDLRALQESRAENRELKQRTTMLESRLNEMLAAYNSRPQEHPQPAANAVPEIPPAEDALGRIDWIVNQLQRQAEAAAQSRTETAAERQHANYVNTLKAMEDQFRAKTPDYDEAISFVAESRDKELQLLYPLSTAEQRSQYIVREWDMIAQSNLNARMNPAEQIYRLATSRGYTPKQAAAAAQQVAQQQPRPMDTQQLAAAQQRHQSLSDAPGGGSTAPMDAKALASMTDKQFKAWLSQKGNEGRLDEIMGA